MATIQIFDPAMCCATGVCGVDVDQALVTFAADLEWLKSQGAQVTRTNLGQQPQAFADDVQVRQLLQSQGDKALPAVLVDGKLKSSGRHPSRDELAGWAGVGVLTSLFTDQVAELVAIGAAIASNCEPCFKFHYDKARKLGVADADVRRAVELAQRVKDAPARAVLNLAYGYLDSKDPKTDSKKDTLAAIAVKAAAPPATGACCAPAPATAAAGSKCC